MPGRVASLVVVFCLAGAACSGGGDRPTLTDATVAPEVTVAGAVEERAVQELTTTSVAVDLPSTTLVASTSTLSTTTTEPDDGPPPAPAGVRCGPGAAEGELSLSWDAPAEDDDVANYRAYVDAGDGRFVQRANFAAADAVAADGRQTITVPEVPRATAVYLAVTAFDTDGNESGWNPVDAWYGSAGGGCNTGAPASIEGATVARGGVDGEVTVTFAPSSADVASYEASVSQPGSAGPHRVGAVAAEGGSVVMVISGIDYDAPFSLDITAVDFHGNSSNATAVSCRALSSDAGC